MERGLGIVDLDHVLLMKGFEIWRYEGECFVGQDLVLCLA